MVNDPTKDLTGRARQFVAAFLIAALLCLTATAQHPQQIITGKVVGVSDGDMITVLDDQKRQYKVRLVRRPEDGRRRQILHPAGVVYGVAERTPHGAA
jgi:endonuclease YncB( thermonuclease family)